MPSFYQDQTLLDEFTNSAPKPGKDSFDIPTVNILDWTQDPNGKSDVHSKDFKSLLNWQFVRK